MFASIHICADVGLGAYLRFVFVDMRVRMWILRSIHAIVFQVVSDFLALGVSKFDSALPL